jgi:hypothetical protein
MDKKRLNLLQEQEDLYNNNCNRCAIIAAIEKAGHGQGNQDYYCNMLCPTGKKLREIGQQIDLHTLNKKALELNKSNLRLLIDKGLNNEQMAKYFNTSPSTIARKKREFGLTLKNYNSSLTKELYKKERADGLSRTEIAAKYNMGGRTLQRKLTEWGII